MGSGWVGMHRAICVGFKDISCPLQAFDEGAGGKEAGALRVKAEALAKANAARRKSGEARIPPRAALEPPSPSPQTAILGLMLPRQPFQEYQII